MDRFLAAGFAGEKTTRSAIWDGFAPGLTITLTPGFRPLL
jgi:hypothetical protein